MLIGYARVSSGLQNLDLQTDALTQHGCTKDRLGRNMQDLIQIVNTLNEQGIGFHSLQENLTMDKSNATGQLMFHLFAAFAEFERNLIEERSAAGRPAARARGRLGGRPEKYGSKILK